MIDKKKVCKHEHGHPGHLCVLASRGEIEEIKALVKNPKFMCFNCGRVADREGNLCSPMPLEG
jgi:hypothetical protein